MSEYFPGGYRKVEDRVWTTHYGKNIEVVEKECDRLNESYSNFKIHRKTIAEAFNNLAFSIIIEFEDEASEAQFIMRELL